MTEPLLSEASTDEKFERVMSHILNLALLLDQATDLVIDLGARLDKVEAELAQLRAGKVTLQ